MLIVLDRADYWQTGLVFPKGQYLGLRIPCPSFLAVFPLLPTATFSRDMQADVVDRQGGIQETVARCFVK